MDKESKDKLIKYLNKKGIKDIEVDQKYNEYIDIPYGKDDVFVTIRLSIYGNYIRFSTPGETPKYKNYGKWITFYRKSTQNRRGCKVCRKVGGEDINKLKIKTNKKSYLYSTVYKNILLIQSWLEPVIEEKIIIKKDLNQYASELKFYFKDKYGNVKLNISGDNVKEITAEIKCKDGSTEYHNMSYENGGYFLNSIKKSWYWNEKVIYKERKKKEKIFY